ncbi:MAG: BamA/TamA family outer membrane protein [Bacteroidales bacterium]|nr:BamA/TamA family outer membrane protein [Bacteroidales bacterium]
MLTMLSACNVSKNLADNEYLLHKNNIIYTDKSIRSAPLEDYIIQQPTPKFLGFFYNNVGIYYALKDKEGWFNKWILRVFGDEPVFLDKYSSEESAKRMKSFLNNLSYFNTEIDINYKTKDKKTTVEYIIKPYKPYTINHFEWISTDTNILKKIASVSNETLIKEGEVYNSYLLDDERDRITEHLRSIGYYRFNKNYINYSVDSAFNNQSLSIIAEINIPAKIKNDSTKAQEHQLYSIRDIYIYPNYDPLAIFDYEPDTLLINIPSDRGDNSFDKYYFIYYNTLKIRPKVIGQSIFLENNSLFNVKELKRSYQKLNRFPIYKYVNISFTEDSITTKSNTLPLDVSIRLSRTKTQSYTIETDVTNTSGDLGLRGNLVYSNRNLFRGGEMISLRLSTALESRTYSNYETTNDNLLFNTMEYGLYLSLRTPNFLTPGKKIRFSKYLAPKSIFQLSYNFQTRPSYQRHIANTSFGYEWDLGQHSLHRLFPVDLSIIKIFPSPEFQANLDTLTNIRYKDQYTDHFIAALKYSLIYNTQKSNKWENFTYLLFRFEIAGNLASLINDMSNVELNPEGYYTLFGIRHAQYVRGEIDFRHFYALPNKHGFIYRTIIGIGIPYGNSSALPFEKGFYSGGANGMRGWAYRTLGPGGYSENSINEFDKMGEIKLEASVEYRFPLFWYLNGALFADVGNIWLLKENELFPDGNFKWNNFTDQLAVDGGLGFRFDFEFFIIRLDAAVKFRDPARESGKRIVFDKTKFSDIFWNFGIGYPF